MTAYELTEPCDCAACVEAPNDTPTRVGQYAGAIWGQLDPAADKATAIRAAEAAIIVADRELESVGADRDTQAGLVSALRAELDATQRENEGMRADRDRLAATVERLRELADGWVKNGAEGTVRRHMISAGQILGERLDALSAPEEGSNDE